MRQMVTGGWLPRSPFDVPPRPFALGSREVGSIVASARFLPKQCGFDNESSGVGHVRFLGGALWQSRDYLVELADALSEPFGGPRDTGVLPHNEAHLVRGNLRGATVGERRHSPGLLS